MFTERTDQPGVLGEYVDILEERDIDSAEVHLEGKSKRALWSPHGPSEVPSPVPQTVSHQEGDGRRSLGSWTLQH